MPKHDKHTPVEPGPMGPSRNTSGEPKDTYGMGPSRNTSGEPKADDSGSKKSSAMKQTSAKPFKGRPGTNPVDA